MDGTRFDHLTQQLGRATQGRTGRRGLLAVAVGFVTGVSASPEAAAKRRSPRRKTKAEACIPTGKQCPSKKPRGKKRKKLGCQDCCQRHVTTTSDGQQVCACQPGSLPCRETRECCGGVCTGGTCQTGTAQLPPPLPLPPPAPCAACTATQLCEDGICRDCDLVCGTQEPAACGAALRTAITTATPGATIRLCPGTYSGGELRITQDLTLIGAGDDADSATNTILQQTRTFSVVSIFESGIDVTLRSLRITGGRTFVGGGIDNVNPGDTLTLIASTVTGNTATVGGGIFTAGTLELFGSTVIGNTADAYGGGIVNENVFGGGTASLDAASRVTGNTAPDGEGGGIANDRGTVTLVNEQIVTDNTGGNCAPVNTIPNCIG